MRAQGWGETGQEILAFLLAARCPGCDRAGTLLCDPCRALLTPEPRHLLTPDGLPVTAALAYDGVAARCIRHLKEEGATMLTRPLGDTLRSILADTVVDCGAAAIVPVPTSRAAFRRRGYRVPELLVRRAGAIPKRMLQPRRQTGDQRALGRVERARNVAGSMRVRAAGSAARKVIIFDDVVTTGATLDEAARALRAAGFHPVAAVALAATPKRSDTPEGFRRGSDTTENRD